MTVPYYIEDIFIEFIDICTNVGVSMQQQDRSAAYSFYQNIQNRDSFTENQAKYIVKILYKYRNVVRAHLDYEDRLLEPRWKKPFRTIDLSKKVWIEKDTLGAPSVVFRFPYQFKETFDNEISVSQVRSTWDRERKVRVICLYDINLIQVYEFCKNNQFEIDDSFMEAMSVVEEIWQNREYILQTSTIREGVVELTNASPDALEYFEKHRTGSTNNDLLLAKNMGYPSRKFARNKIETIAASPSNTFWVKTQKEFIELAYQIDGKIAIILDRTSESIPWIMNLAETIESCGYNKKDFRVCFRAKNTIDPEFNQWVSKNKFGGKIADAKFLIFQHKPPKWLFNGENDVIILASNELLPSTNSTTRSMFQHHPCVIYIGEYKPTKQEDNIIEL